MVKLLQQAYAKVLLERFDQEKAKVYTEAEVRAFKAKWGDVADKLADGWILDVGSV